MKIERSPRPDLYHFSCRVAAWIIPRAGAQCRAQDLDRAIKTIRIWRVTPQEHITRLNELINTEAEFDPEKRHQIYTECQQIIRDEGGTVVPVFADFVDVANNRVKFGERASDWPLDGDRCAERWWFES